eukprot:g5506.t1 g5506   contig2:666682-670873(+)
MADTICLTDWLDLSLLHEERQIQHARQSPEVGMAALNGLVGGGAAASFARRERDAKLAYVDRAVRVALLLIECLIQRREGDGGDVCAQDVSLDNFVVEIDTLNSVPSRDPDTQDDCRAVIKKVRQHLKDKKRNQLLDSYLISILSRTSNVKLASNLKQEMGTQVTQNGGQLEVFKQIGLIFHQLFCRGVTAPNHDQEAEPAAPGAFEDEFGSGSSRSLKRMNLLDSDEQLIRFNVPTALRILVTDLMHQPSEEDEHKMFESLEEVGGELSEVLEKRGLFLYELDARHIGKLHFDGHAIYGRTEELETIFEEADAVLLGEEITMNRLVLIGAPPGSGKSFLVESAEHTLASTGWLSMDAKFDRLMNRRPLSAIASAFEDFIASIVEDVDEEEYSLTIEGSLRRRLSASAILTLCDLVPSLRGMFPDILRRVVSDPDLSNLAEESDENAVHQSNLDDIVSSADTSRNRLHYIFRTLIHVISSHERPLLFFLDDLQWADMGSLDLFASLLMDFDHIDQFGNADHPQCVLFIGNYRSNEIDEENMLRSYVQKFESSGSVEVTNLLIHEMTKEEINSLVSETLRLPSRVTKPLANVIEAKTRGNAFHVKQFMKSVSQDNMLHYSLSGKRWMWDIDAIKSIPMNSDVAELLTKDMLLLPAPMQKILRILSCFGTQCDETIVYQLSTCKAYECLQEGIESAIGENMLEKRGHTFCFPHDILQQTVYESMSPEERASCHHEIGVALLSIIPIETNFNALKFTAINQINRSEPYGVTDPSRHVEYASINLKAGERSLGMSDFELALDYIKCGLTFLNETSWETDYELCLHLNDAASLACYVSARYYDMNDYLEKLFRNAKRVEDKLSGYHIRVQSLFCMVKTTEAIEQSFVALDEIGICFPSELTPTMVQADIAPAKELLNEFLAIDITTAPRMSDSAHIFAMKLMTTLWTYLFLSKPEFLLTISFRMLKISKDYGICSYTAFGVLYTANFLQKIDENQDMNACYQWGKIALLLLETLEAKDLIPNMKAKQNTIINFWVEPIQSTASVLRDNRKDALMLGDVEVSMSSAISYCRQSFFGGVNLAVCEKESVAVAQEMSRLKQYNLSYFMSAHRLVILKLLGSETDPFVLCNGDFKDEEELFEHAKAQVNTGILEHIYFNRLFIAYWFKRYDEAIQFIGKSRGIGAVGVYLKFYEGLTAFHFLRDSNDSEWMGIGEDIMTSFQMWSEQRSNWNWENKALLLQAEWHFSKGEHETAKEKYLASIDSARKHRFVHEEGLAMELLGICCAASGDVDGARWHTSKAFDCYESWGAVGLLRSMDN